MGTGTSPLIPKPGADTSTAVAIQTDGRIVASGYTFPSVATGNEGALARYNSDGSLDNSFGTGGKVTFDMLGGSNDFFYGTALDSIGRAVVAGETSGNITIVRVLGNFASRNVPFDFDGDGKSDIAIWRAAVSEWWIQKSSNSSVVAFQFGNSNDKPVQGDYTGDGKSDMAIFRPSTPQNSDMVRQICFFNKRVLPN